MYVPTLYRLVNERNEYYLEHIYREKLQIAYQLSKGDQNILEITHKKHWKLIVLYKSYCLLQGKGDAN